ncbi:protein Lines homolog 1 isoform X1 [Synchiropus splendidus]|uniref:protein Lines homolog 1 isoform X1 n=1 Tax=Synchiropus splendidus TaxID=270530 RepID=UPI00237E2777|nr:protein Lines homolog 1 isoform X1 [Synchiropus splendidus]
MEVSDTSSESCSAAGPWSDTECLERLTGCFTSLQSSSCPRQRVAELASAVHSAASRAEAGEYCHGNELRRLSLTLVEKMVSSLAARSSTAQLASYCEELTRLLFGRMDLMCPIVDSFRSPDQIVSHLATKAASSYVSHQLHTSGTVSQAWLQACQHAFLTSDPSSELDACLWSLTSVLKKLLKGSHPDLAVKLLEMFDTSVCVVCSRFLPLEQESVPMMEHRHWSTTFCTLLNLLEALAASAALCTSDVCLQSQRLTHVHASSLLTTVTRCSQYRVKKPALLLLKRVLLQKPGEEWLSGGVRNARRSQDVQLLAQSVLRAVTAGWLQGLEVRTGSFFGGTCQSLEQKKDYVILRAVSVVLLKAAEVHIEAGAPSAGSPGVAPVLETLQTLWHFLRQQGVEMQEVGHSCCFLTLLFVEQDDDLMEAAASLLSIFLHCRTSIGPGSGEGRDACESGCNPHCHFLLLLQSISYDHSILLDFLISMETCFLEYFVRYLKYLLSDRQGFTQACRKMIPQVDSPTRTRPVVKMAATSYKQTGGVDPGIRLVEYDSSEESDAEVMEVSQGSSPVSCRTLARTVDCLWQLREVVTRLHAKNLFPYNPTSLLRLLTENKQENVSPAQREGACG